MAGRTYNLDPELLNPFEIGAMLIAILAWPEPHLVEQQMLGAEALCSGWLTEACEMCPEEAPRLKTQFPEYAGVTPKAAKARLRTLRRRLNDRMVAARMARGFMQEALTGHVVLPATMKQLSVNQLSRLVKTDRPTIDDPEMIERRVWRPSWPVIHLALAFDVLLTKLGADAASFQYPIDNEGLNAWIIEVAWRHELFVLEDPRFGVSAESLIRVRQPALRAAA
jgi:hypothetical protein